MQETVAHYSDAGLSITPLGPFLGALVDGIDLAAAPDDVCIATLRRALVRHKVLFFRNQEISQDQHIALGRRFGTLDCHPAAKKAGHPEIMLIEPNAYTRVGGMINENALTVDKWHADGTFLEKPYFASILRPRILPPLGGNTLWADAAAAYDSLSAATRARIENLYAMHDIEKVFGADYLSAEQLEQQRRMMPPRRQPLVWRIPETGRRVLFVNQQFVTHIDGISKAESDDLLRELFGQFHVPEIQVRFQWDMHSVAMWDNRQTQHYPVVDYLPQPRHMERVTILGEHVPTRD